MKILKPVKGHPQQKQVERMLSNTPINPKVVIAKPYRTLYSPSLFPVTTEVDLG